MAFPDAKIDAALLHAASAYRADLKTAFNALHTALTTEWVTDAGNAATDATFVQMEEDLIDYAETVASQFTDQ
jgi:hypothetical protein